MRRPSIGLHKKEKKEIGKCCSPPRWSMHTYVLNFEHRNPKKNYLVGVVE